MFEIVPAITENDMLQISYIFINILGVFGVIVDPTTVGFSDSERALTYYKSE